MFRIPELYLQGPGKVTPRIGVVTPNLKTVMTTVVPAGVTREKSKRNSKSNCSIVNIVVIINNNNVTINNNNIIA